MEERTRATLADLITYKESPFHIKESEIKKPPKVTPIIDNAYLLFFDGSYRKSHNAESSGIALYDPQGELMVKRGFKLAVQSNNEAEYATLETGLQFFLEYGIKRLQIKGDALLVVKQVLGVWQSKNPNLKKFCLKVQNLLKKFEAWSLKHIDRNLNEEAHNAAQEMITHPALCDQN